MDISPREIYNQSLSYYHFVTRLKLSLSIVFFLGLPFVGDEVIILINIPLAAINCILIIGLLELLPRMFRDAMQNKDGKYAVPKAILDWSTLIIIEWLFISTAISVMLGKIL